MSSCPGGPRICIRFHSRSEGRNIAYCNLTSIFGPEPSLQASSGRALFDTSPLHDNSSEQSVYDAAIRPGVQLCSRQRMQDVIHCVGGIAVLFPLFTQLDQPEEDPGRGAEELLDGIASTTVVDSHLALDVIDLLTAVLAGNHSSQLYMLNISGFAVLGFLLQRVNPQHLSVKFVLALENLVGCVSHTQGSMPAPLDSLIRTG